MKESMDEPSVEVVGEAYGFARRHRAELFETRSLAEVAVMVSKATLNYYAGADVPLTDFTDAARAAEAGNFLDELNGWYRALWSAQVPFDLIDEVSLEVPGGPPVGGQVRDLSRYRMIVLPNAACLSSSACSALSEYVRGGGTLVATFETGLYDEVGRRVDRSPLAETFGVAPAGGSKSPSVAIGGPDKPVAAPQRRTQRAECPLEGPRRWDYLFAHGRGPWLDGIAATYIPSPAYALHVEAADTAEVPLTFSKPLADRYAGLAEDSHCPAMMVNSFGAGRAIYFACDFGAALLKWRLGEHDQIVRNLVKVSAPSPVSVPDAPPSVEVSLRGTLDGREVLLHLVNYTGGMTRPMRRVVALRELLVELRVHRPVESVRALWSGRDLDFRATGDRVAFTLPVLAEYELVKVRLAEATAGPQ